MKKKILLDTDIGTDIDDALCLAYLLAQPECDLLGITTVTGESKKRAMLASVLCEIADKTIPIYPGVEIPLNIPQKQTVAQQAQKLPNWKYNKSYPTGQAIEFLRTTIRANPGEITLLTIGPLTNIALLFRIDPEIPNLLKSLVSMCGYFFFNIPDLGLLEWNAIGDPHASDIVYRTQTNHHRSIGLDVTCQVTMKATQFKSYCKHELLKPVSDFADVWFEEQPIVTFHDPLAAATIFNDHICSYKQGDVAIDLKIEKSMGQTLFKSQKETFNHEVADSVNASEFFEEFISVFK